MENYYLKKVFEKNLKKIMKHNYYRPQMITVEECHKVNKLTPVDLVMKEYYVHGGGGAEYFLGIKPSTCNKMAQYIIEHQEELKAKDMYNKKGINESGFTFWDNWILH